MKFSPFFIFGENDVAISSSLFPMGYGSKVRADIGNVKGVIVQEGMIEMCLGQVSVWNFPILVKFQMDSCLEFGSMMPYY